MDPARNKEIARGYADAVNRHDLDAALALVADDLINHGASAQGAAGLRRLLGHLRDAFPDQEWTCQDLVAEGDRVACRLSWRGTNTGPLCFTPVPLPATGRRFETECLTIFRLQDGKIAELWAARDDIRMLRQLGLLVLERQS